MVAPQSPVLKTENKAERLRERECVVWIEASNVDNSFLKKQIRATLIISTCSLIFGLLQWWLLQ